MRTKQTVVTFLFGLGFVALAEPTFAVQWTMDTATLTPLSSNCTSVVGPTAQSCSITNSGITSTATAFATTNQTTNITLQNAYIGVYSPGIGVTNLLGTSPEGTRASPSSPYHTMDNAGQYETILFHFSSAVTIDQIAIGFPSSGQNCIGTTKCGADISVLAYSPGGASSPYAPSGSFGSLTGATFNKTSLTSNGWTVVGNYGNLTNNCPGTTCTGGVTGSAQTGTAIVSTDWLIAAYDPSFGACVDASSTDHTACGTNADFVKIMSLTGTTPTQHKTPEPDALALLGIAALAGYFSRRRRVATSPR